jgi:hypothetical protein
VTSCTADPWRFARQAHREWLHAVSPLAPDGSSPAWLLSEHPVALKTLGNNGLAALILTAPEDPALHQRIQDTLGRRGLTRGRVRVGSDRRELWPLRADMGELLVRQCSMARSSWFAPSLAAWEWGSRAR